MELLCCHHGLTLDDAIAVGDSTNDLAMLTCAGLSIAMGSGDPRIFDQVDYVAPAVQEDGLARAMAHFSLIDGLESAG